jgi:hypothetical protein
MGRRKTERFNCTFSTEPLTTYRGNPIFNIHFLAVAFLYDFPSVARNPKELQQIINRWKLNKATKKDKIIIEILKNRLSSFNEGKEIADMLSKLAEIPT